MVWRDGTLWDLRPEEPVLGTSVTNSLVMPSILMGDSVVLGLRLGLHRARMALKLVVE